MKTKLSEPQKAAFAFLPCSPADFEKKVPKKTREVLFRKGLVVETWRKPTSLEKSEGVSHDERIPLLKPRFRLIPESFWILLAESRRVGLPKSHSSDLRYDRDSLIAYQPKKFAWVLRECGTCLLFDFSVDMHGNTPVGYIEAVHRNMDHGKNCRYYWFADGKLTEMTFPALRDKVVREASEWLKEFGNILDLTDKQLVDVINRYYVLRQPVAIYRHANNQSAEIRDSYSTRFLVSRIHGKLQVQRI